MYSEPVTVLVVDDEPRIADLLYQDLIEVGYDCIKATTGEEALERLSKDNCDVMLLELKLPGISGMDVLGKMKSDYPETAVIVVTALGDTQTAVEAMKIGAVDYITKPFELEKINSSIETTLRAKVIDSNMLTPDGGKDEASGGEAGWTRYIDDIAEGVQTRLDLLTGHVMTLTVIENTISIAQTLDMPEDQIEKWVDNRRKDIERVKIMDRLVEKGL